MQLEFEGLDGAPKSEWAAVGNTEAPAIDKLVPGSAHHQLVLDYLLKRLRYSENKMQYFHSRWKAAEQRVQAYINLTDYEKLIKKNNDQGKPASVTSITVPYSFATIASIVTYLIHTFSGRKPMFQLESSGGTLYETARYMEQVLQYNADHTRLVRELFQYFQDGETYGMCVLITRWREKKRIQTRYREVPALNFGLSPLGPQGTQKERVREEAVVYQGNEVYTLDPYMFFPDPRVPMIHVNKLGEYVFWRRFVGKHTLKIGEAAGEFKYINRIQQISGDSEYANQISSRGLVSGGDGIAGAGAYNLGESIKNYYQIDQGTVEIIPAELGLSTSTKVEKWMFTVANKNTIIQAERIDLDHGMHPVAVSEPYTMGHGFGHPSMADYLGPVQDAVSWFINSHIFNVKATLNNMFVVDPSMVEMQDLKNPQPGLLIRLKRAAYGQDARRAISQLATQDVTQNHIRDMDMFMKMGDAMSAINDNLRGISDNNSRKSATEARMSGQAAASRLASHAMLHSSQGIQDLTEQMVLNIQQNMTDEFAYHVTGKDGGVLRLAPEMLVGDFNFPVHDGTLPMDRIAMLDVWKEIFFGVAGDEQLRQTYDLPKLFEFVGELGGAKNIASMRLQPNQQLEGEVQAGNMIPTNALGGAPMGDSSRGAQRSIMAALGA